MQRAELRYEVAFAAPAFVGNADQRAQWRTPPFKALIRQWWRVVKAPHHTVAFDVGRLRSAENALFGSAADEAGAESSQSRVRLRLSTWDDGALTSWPAGEQRVPHPEAGRQVGAELYLGYGPRNAGHTAIDHDATASIRLSVPVEDIADLCHALQLAAWFGSIGSRSRNGWGSVQFSGDRLKPLSRSNLESLGVVQRLDACLRREWPHAIGSDRRGPLVWTTPAKANWRQVVRDLAEVKIAFRTQSALSLHGVRDGTFSDRHLLAYPVTHHRVRGETWGNSGRLANQIRFKLLRETAGVRGIIVHLPCSLPREMANELPPQVRRDLDDLQMKVWPKVHEVLDQRLTRLT